MFSTGKFPHGVDRSPGIITVAPAPYGIKVLETKTDRIEDFVAIGANGILAVKFGPLAQGQILDGLFVLLIERGNVRRWRWHLFAQHLFEHPHAAFDGAGAVGKGGDGEDTGHAQNSAAVGVSELDLAPT